VAAVADVDVPTVADVPGELAVAFVPEEDAAETGTGGMGAALADRIFAGFDLGRKGGRPSIFIAS
jgi:CO/xanthine dehydrogenase Mo-binding subunit